MDHYSLASSETTGKPSGPASDPKPAANEIRITTTGTINGYVAYGQARLKVSLPFT